jgi:hypothetical protein
VRSRDREKLKIRSGHGQVSEANDLLSIIDNVKKCQSSSRQLGWSKKYCFHLLSLCACLFCLLFHSPVFTWLACHPRARPHKISRYNAILISSAPPLPFFLFNSYIISAQLLEYNTRLYTNTPHHTTSPKCLKTHSTLPPTNLSFLHPSLPSAPTIPTPQYLSTASSPASPPSAYPPPTPQPSQPCASPHTRPSRTR